MTRIEFSNHHTISNGYDGNKRNSPFGQELCNHRNHWKWYDGRVYHHRWYHEGRWCMKNKDL